MASEQGYMLRWGQFTFKLTTAAFQKLSRQDAWRWVTQERLNNDPAEQYVGRGSRVISLEGVIFGAYDPGGQIAPGVRVSNAVGTHQLDLIRYYADQGQPAIMVDGRGNVLGPWVLVGMREDQEYFLQNGAPQKQTFGIEMRYYAPDSGSGFVNYSRTSPIQAIQGVAGAFMDLARKTNAFTGQVATALSNYGLTNDNAAAAAQATNDFQNQNINSVVPYMTDMATLMGGVFGLKGDDYTNGLAILTNNFGATGFNDARSILNTGMPGIEAGLSALGVSDSAAAVNALAFTAVAPTSGDRGVFLNNLGGQLAGLNGNLTALNDIGVNTQVAMGQSQVDRTSALLSDLRTVEATNPAALESVLPAASNAELRSVISNYDGFESARLSIGQSVSTPIPATSMRGD